MLARELYCLDGLSLAEAANLAGVSLAAVRKWAAGECWQEERESVAAKEREIRRNILEARALALQKLLDWKDDKETALALSAVDKLEKLALAGAKHRSESARGAIGAKAAEKQKNIGSASLKQLTEGMDSEGRIALMEEGVNRQIAYLLQGPVENFSEHVRQIKAGLDALASLKGKGEGITMEVRFDE